MLSRAPIIAPIHRIIDFFGVTNNTYTRPDTCHLIAESLVNKPRMSGSILVTGGAGYVGSHTLVELVEAGYDVVVMDNLVNSSMDSMQRVNQITGKTIPSYSVDLMDKKGLQDLFSKHKFSCVMHFAGLKAVGESCEKPLLYYRNNIGGTMTLLEVMQEFGVYNMIFSSSATVYGVPQYLPLDEKHPVGGCTNPYGQTKYFIEQILRDMCTADKQWNAVLLRYFNPVGAHASGKIGEDPQGIPNNLMPYVSQVAVGRREKLTVYGNDYDTPDGTGVRDYIHVVDLAKGHVAALKQIEEKCGCKILLANIVDPDQIPRYVASDLGLHCLPMALLWFPGKNGLSRVYNLGTGKGYSVIEMAKAFEKASGKPVPYQIAGRRAGDVASCYADAKLAEKEMGWTAKLDLTKMCEDLWRWQSTNPTGFQKGDS